MNWQWSEWSFGTLVVVQVTLLLTFAWAITALLRRHSAAIRHRVWILAVAGSLVAPVFVVYLPKYRVPVLPAAQTNNGSPTVASASAASMPARETVLKQEVAPSFSVSQSSGTSSHPVTEVNRVDHLADQRSTEVVAPVGAFQWATILAVVWATGFAVSAVRMGAQWWALGRVISQSNPLIDDAWQADTAWAAKILGLRRIPRILVGATSTMPMVAGAIRPCLIVPRGAEAWPKERRRHVLLHEVAHIVRNDIASQWLARWAAADRTGTRLRRLRGRGGFVGCRLRQRVGADRPRVRFVAPLACARIC